MKRKEEAIKKEKELELKEKRKKTIMRETS